MKKTEKTTIIVQCIVLSILLHAVLIVSITYSVMQHKPKPVTLKEKTPTSPQDKVITVYFTPPSSPKTEEAPLEPQQTQQSQSTQPPEPLTPEEELEELKKKLAEKVPNAVVQLPSTRFQRTSQQQASANEPVPETNLYGERDTIAKSTAQANPNAPSRPAVEGEINPRTNDVFDSKFNDGKISDSGGSSNNQTSGQPNGITESNSLKPSEPSQSSAAQPNLTPQQIEAKIAEQVQQAASELAKSTEAVAPEAPTEPASSTKTLDTGKTLARSAQSEQDRLDELERLKKLEQQRLEKIEQAKQKKAQAERIEQLKKEALATAKAQATSEAATAAKSAAAQAAKKGASDPSRDPFAVARGMTPGVQKTAQSGSVNRQGSTASHNVEASELGKYKNTIMRSVESQWRKICRDRAGLILPGQLMVKFVVNSNGKVVDVDFIDESAGGPSNKGITLDAIRQATIPAMSSKLKSSRSSAPVDVTITFNF